MSSCRTNIVTENHFFPVLQTLICILNTTDYSLCLQLKEWSRGDCGVWRWLGVETSITTTLEHTSTHSEFEGVTSVLDLC